MAEEIIRIYPNENLSFNIDNLTDSNLQDLVEFTVTLEKEGEILETESFDLDVEPGNNYWYFLNTEKPLTNGEYIYNIEGKLKKAYEGLKKGTTLAHAQKLYFVNDNPEEKEEKKFEPLEIIDDNTNDIIFKAKGFEAVFSKPLGGLVSLTYDGVDYLKSKPLITFWRPLTDTDLHLGYNFDSAPWMAATIGQQLLPEKFYYVQQDLVAKLIFVYRYPIPGGQENAVTYQVFPDGTIDIETIYSGLATMDTIPVFGMDFKINKDCDSFRYYGYGPEENYIDTTEGLDLGVYESTVRKNFNKKIRPQESGNRTGVRWAEVYNSKTGKGIRFTAIGENFEFNALPYNTFEIEAADDASQLSKINHTNVRIAGKVSGVGDGDHIANWARIDAGEMITLHFSISPVDVNIKKEKTEKPKKKEPAKKASKESQSSADKAKSKPATKTTSKTATETISSAAATKSKTKEAAKKEPQTKKEETSKESSEKTKRDELKKVTKK